MSALKEGDDGALNALNLNDSPNSGAVNEVRQTSSALNPPLPPLGHVFHTLNSLYRYPNFLDRHSLSSIDRQENDLELYLSKLRSEKARIIAARENVASVNAAFCRSQSAAEKPLFDRITVSQLLGALQPPARKLLQRVVDSAGPDALDGGDILHFLATSWTGEHKPYDLEDFLSQIEHDGEDNNNNVWTASVFNLEFCASILSHLKDYTEFRRVNNEGEPAAALNLDISQVPGCEWVQVFLTAFLIKPISKLLFVDELVGEGAVIDWSQSYIASYKATGENEGSGGGGRLLRSRLVEHTDDAEVTANLRLSPPGAYTGGCLKFTGLRGAKEKGFEVQLVTGEIVFHSGRHFHSVTNVDSGERDVLVTWARSSSTRKVTCPCCWLNRRGVGGAEKAKGGPGPCICSTLWTS
jgi:hypothetical protein